MGTVTAISKGYTGTDILVAISEDREIIGYNYDKKELVNHVTMKYMFENPGKNVLVRFNELYDIYNVGIKQIWGIEMFTAFTIETVEFM